MKDEYNKTGEGKVFTIKRSPQRNQMEKGDSKESQRARMGGKCNEDIDPQDQLKKSKEKIRSDKNRDSEEWKELIMTEAPAEQFKKYPEYPKRYIVKWQWKNCKPNKKTFWDREKAERLYECMDIDGWQAA